MDMPGLMLRLVLLCLFALKVTALQLQSPPARSLSMPCRYDYEAQGSIPQLSLQWRSPSKQLLCHFIKHKNYRNCTAGYSVLYKPGNVTLVIDEVKEEDFGRHVCSISKRHDFSDFTIELVRGAESSATPPTDKEEHSGKKFYYIMYSHHYYEDLSDDHHHSRKHSFIAPYSIWHGGMSMVVRWKSGPDYPGSE